MADFSDLKVGDRVNIRYVGLLMKNLVVTEVNSKCLVVEHIYPFSRNTGQACDQASDHMQLVRKDNM